jgi:hypothetical protein
MTQNVFSLFMSILQDPFENLASLVPSQGTERTSGMISGISLPQRQQETGPDTGSSSIFTSGGANWTQRGSDDEDLFVKSNDSDTTIEIPEVKYQAVGEHCKKRQLQGFVTCEQKDLIEAR